MVMRKFPLPIKGSNDGDGSPLILGDPEVIGDLSLPSYPGAYPVPLSVNIIDWDGDGKNELVHSASDVFTYHVEGHLADGTPIVDRGLCWGERSRTPQREEQSDMGFCGRVLATGDFDGDGWPEAILAPRGYSKAPTVVLPLRNDASTSRSQGILLTVTDPKQPAGTNTASRWNTANMTAMDWNGDGRPDLLVASSNTEGYWFKDPATGGVPVDPRDRYTREGVWKGKEIRWSLHLLRNTGTTNRPEFTYVGQVELSTPLPRGPLSVADPRNPKAGVLILDYYGGLWHLPLLENGEWPRFGELQELFSLHGSPFTRTANMTSIAVGDVDNSGRLDLFASGISSSAYWCRYYGVDKEGRPIYDSPRKVKQRNAHVNGGYFSVPTVGDWRGTGIADLVVGSAEGYIVWYKTLSTKPLRFAPPERVRWGDIEIRRYAKPNPARGYYWGSSQGPLDGFNGGYSNPVLVDWDGDGLLDLLVSDMIGLYDWYSNKGTKTRPSLGPPQRLHIDGEPLFSPWRMQPGVVNLTNDGLPDLITMDWDLDLALYRRVGREDLSGLQPGVKLRYEDGGTIKTGGIYTSEGGDGRGRTKIQVVDWNHDGKWDLVLGVGPQGGSAFPGSYVLLCLNAGSSTKPVFKHPVPLLYNDKGEPLEFWRHPPHPAVVDWDEDGEWELVVGADQPFLWYFKPEHFGKPAVEGAPAPSRSLEDVKRRIM